MKNVKKALGALCIMILLVGIFIPTYASSLMSASLTGYFHYIPIFSDEIRGTTYYGTNQYVSTAQAKVYTQAYASNNSFNQSSTVTRSGWDAVSGEGSSGPCTASSWMAGCVHGHGWHSGTIGSSWETTTTDVYP